MKSGQKYFVEILAEGASSKGGILVRCSTWALVSELFFNWVQLGLQHVQTRHTVLAEVNIASGGGRGCGGQSDFWGARSVLFLVSRWGPAASFPSGRRARGL